MMISESRLIPNLSRFRRYSARDVADLAFCYMLALHMCRQEFETAPWAKTYATQSHTVHDWKVINLNRTDLHQFLTLLMGHFRAHVATLKNPDASKLLMSEIHVDAHVVEKFLHNIQNVHFDPELSGRLLMQLERQLKIQTSNYKSMRRILSDWHLDHVDTEARSLVMTRLLQVLRAKAASGDITHKVAQLAQNRNWWMPHACDPETGRNCGMDTVSSKKPSLLKQLAVGAGLGVGAYLLGKALFGPKK